MFSFASNKTTRRAALRPAAVLGVAAALYGTGAFFGTPAAHAQQFIGNAYTAQVGLSLGAGISPFNATANVNASLSNTGFLNTTTPDTKNGLAANTNVAASSGLAGLLSIGSVANDVLRARVVTTTTTSQTPTTGFAVTSVGSVADIGLFNSASVLDLVAGSTSLVTATAIQSTTSADFNGNAIGSSIITGLRVNGQAVTTAVNANGQTVALTDAQGVVQGDNLKVTVYGYNSILANTEVVGTLTFNEKINNADGSLTTNALRLTLTNSAGAPLLVGSVGSKGTGDVVLGSSTAGYRGVTNAAAPEPGSLALLSLGFAPFAGLALRARKRLGK